ncbi:response regulator [Micromonospora chalcea]|uniref:response regulator n=1 Tax=Micromonospora chalcea TaxID=1874 RepID=UPI00288321D9|nr:response regulator [Micromonospora chalcea]
MNAAGNTVRGRVKPLRVLLVEDDPADVALIEESLATHALPAELHHVPDGLEAMAFLRRQGQYVDAPRPELILLDLNMPRVNGREVLAEIKIGSGLKAIPVVVFTPARSTSTRWPAAPRGPTSTSPDPSTWTTSSASSSGSTASTAAPRLYRPVLTDRPLRANGVQPPASRPLRTKKATRG